MSRRQIAVIAVIVAFVFLFITVAYPLIFNPDAQKAAVDTVPVAPPQESPIAPQ